MSTDIKDQGGRWSGLWVKADVILTGIDILVGIGIIVLHFI